MLRNLSFRPDTSLSTSFNHLSSLNSAMLFRRGEIASTSCLHCARDNDRYTECVRIRSRDEGSFPDDFFSDAYASCLLNFTTSYSHSKFHLDFCSLRALIEIVSRHKLRVSPQLFPRCVHCALVEFHESIYDLTSLGIVSASRQLRRC